MIKFWFRWLSLWLLGASALRVYFAYNFSFDDSAVDIFSFLVGVFNDLQSFALIAGFLAFSGLIHRRLLKPTFVLLVAVWLIVFVAEIFFWVEFEGRLDRLVFHYLAYPKEVVFFLEEQFYVSGFILPFALVVAAVVGIVGWPTAGKDARVEFSIPVAFALGVFFIGGALGQGENRVENNLVSNGYLGVLSAARYQENEVEWLHKHKAPRYQEGVASSPLLQQVRKSLSSKKHLILIVEESFAGPTWQNSQSRAKYLPNFVALEAQSVSFTNLFATGSRTTRGLEALLNGFMPLPGISTTQRDKTNRLPSLPRALAHHGFYPVFLYGGWSDFSDFSNYWKAIGFEKIWSREDFGEVFETSWGVSDQALFARILSEMTVLTDQRERVFLSTLTVSHHRPYDFPAGAVVFESARSSQFAMAYADYALGEFMRQARLMPWYEDTLFVIAADHGLQPRGDALIPAESFRIPLLMHAEGLLPRTVDSMGSSISLPSTLLSILGLATEESFWGGNLLIGSTVVPLEYDYHIGLLDHSALRVIKANGEFVKWPYDTVAKTLGQAAQDRNESDIGIVLDAFAPAYQWYYAR